MCLPQACKISTFSFLPYLPFHPPHFILLYSSQSSSINSIKRKTTKPPSFLYYFTYNQSFVFYFTYIITTVKSSVNPSTYPIPIAWLLITSHPPLFVTPQASAALPKPHSTDQLQSTLILIIPSFILLQSTILTSSSHHSQQCPPTITHLNIINPRLPPHTPHRRTTITVLGHGGPLASPLPRTPIAPSAGFEA